MADMKKRIERALTMQMVTDYPPFAQLPPEYYPMRAEYNATPNEMAELIKDLAAENQLYKEALEFYTLKPEYSKDEQGRHVTKFVPRDDGSEWMAKQALKGKF
jgi:hypothetical protein